jgi:hypothetical protein
MTWSFADQQAWIEPIATDLERIAYRLRQGAIPETLAATKLMDLADRLNAPPKMAIKEAHVSSDPTKVNHCVFCGSGAVVARGDGGVECTLCNRSFTVMEQPLYSNMPSTEPGANVDATAHDPLMQEDAFDPGQQQPPTPEEAGQGHQPPGAPQAAPSAAPLQTPSGVAPYVPGLQAGSSLAPFVMRSGEDGFMTRSGVVVNEEDFILHHAIRLVSND